MLQLPEGEARAGTGMTGWHQRLARTIYVLYMYEHILYVEVPGSPVAQIYISIYNYINAYVALATQLWRTWEHILLLVVVVRVRFDPGGICGGPLFAPPSSSARAQSRLEFAELLGDMCSHYHGEIQAGTGITRWYQLVSRTIYVLRSTTIIWYVGLPGSPVAYIRTNICKFFHGW